MSLIFVDCEATGKSPFNGFLTEFGAVEYETRETFHGILYPSRPDPDNPAIRRRISVLEAEPIDKKQVFLDFEEWLHRFPPGYTFVSDNPAFDYQWISYGFDEHLGRNPFGHSARRISDFYAGLNRDWRNTQEWKRFRKTKHDHHPVHDALGNVEAFEEIMRKVKDDGLGLEDILKPARAILAYRDSFRATVRYGAPKEPFERHLSKMNHVLALMDDLAVALDDQPS